MSVPLGVYAVMRTRVSRLNPRALVNELAAACLGGLGTFWLVSRLYA